MCDSGIVLYYARHSFAIPVDELHKVQITQLTTHNCTLSVDGKDAEYFPLDKLDIVQNYCTQAVKEFVLPSTTKRKSTLADMMDASEEDGEDEEDDEFKGAVEAGNESD